MGFIGEVVIGSDVKTTWCECFFIKVLSFNKLGAGRSFVGHDKPAILGVPFEATLRQNGCGGLVPLNGATRRLQDRGRPAQLWRFPPEIVGVPLLKLLTGKPRVILCSSRRGLETLVLFSGLKSHTTGKLPDVRCLPPIIRVRT